MEVELEGRAGARLNGPKGMPNPAALHPHLGMRSEEFVMLKFDGKGEQRCRKQDVYATVHPLEIERVAVGTVDVWVASHGGDGPGQGRGRWR